MNIFKKDHVLANMNGVEEDYHIMKKIIDIDIIRD